MSRESFIFPLSYSGLILNEIQSKLSTIEVLIQCFVFGRICCKNDCKNDFFIYNNWNWNCLCLLKARN